MVSWSGVQLVAKCYRETLPGAMGHHGGGIIIPLPRQSGEGI